MITARSPVAVPNTEVARLSITMVVLRAMKTAISIPDDVFEGAERTAETLGMSRSELYETAVREFIERYRSVDVTERLDRVYGEDDSLSRLDERLQTLQAYSLGREDWR